MVVVGNGNGEQKSSSGTHPLNWSLIWADKEDEKKLYRLKCSVCLTDLDCGVVFPEPGLRICLRCLSSIHETAINNLENSDDEEDKSSRNFLNKE